LVVANQVADKEHVPELAFIVTTLVATLMLHAPFAASVGLVPAFVEEVTVKLEPYVELAGAPLNDTAGVAGVAETAAFAVAEP
jgi:hypothetical protein